MDKNPNKESSYSFLVNSSNEDSNDSIDNEYSKSGTLKFLIKNIKKALRYKYDTTAHEYNLMKIETIIQNRNRRSIFGLYLNENLIGFTENLRRSFNPIESVDLIRKLACYYKNYLRFFCNPLFCDFRINSIIQQYGDQKAEICFRNKFLNKENETNDIFPIPEIVIFSKDAVRQITDFRISFTEESSITMFFRNRKEKNYMINNERKQRKFSEFTYSHLSMKSEMLKSKDTVLLNEILNRLDENVFKPGINERIKDKLQKTKKIENNYSTTDKTKNEEIHSQKIFNSGNQNQIYSKNHANQSNKNIIKLTKGNNAKDKKITNPFEKIIINKKPNKSGVCKDTFIKNNEKIVETIKEISQIQKKPSLNVTSQRNLRIKKDETSKKDKKPEDRTAFLSPRIKFNSSSHFNKSKEEKQIINTQRIEKEKGQYEKIKLFQSPNSGQNRTSQEMLKRINCPPKKPQIPVENKNLSYMNLKDENKISRNKKFLFLSPARQNQNSLRTKKPVEVPTTSSLYVSYSRSINKNKKWERNKVNSFRVGISLVSSKSPNRPDKKNKGTYTTETSLFNSNSLTNKFGKNLKDKPEVDSKQYNLTSNSKGRIGQKAKKLETKISDLDDKIKSNSNQTEIKVIGMRSFKK